MTSSDLRFDEEIKRRRAAAPKISRYPSLVTPTAMSKLMFSVFPLMRLLMTIPSTYR
jgi:hypothetical protein